MTESLFSTIQRTASPAQLRDISRFRSFRLDEDASRLLGQVACGPNIVNVLPVYRALARAPFTYTFIEWDYDAFHRGKCDVTGVVETLTDEDRREGDVPSKYGAMIQSPTDDQLQIEFIGLNRRLPRADLYPLLFKLNMPPSSDDTELLAAAPEVEMKAWGVECSPEAFAASPLNDGKFAFAVQRRFFSLLKADTLDEVSQKLYRLVKSASEEQAGDLRYVVTALALINHVPTIMTSGAPRGSYRSGGRLRPFMSETVVQIDIPARRRRIVEWVERTIRAEHARRRRHEVRGHWRVCDRSHGEAWQPFFDPNAGMKTRWRRWIAPHERGDASIGWVNKQYEVGSPS